MGPIKCDICGQVFLFDPSGWRFCEVCRQQPDEDQDEDVDINANLDSNEPD